MTLLLDTSTFLFEKLQVPRDTQMLHANVQKGQQKAILSVKKPQNFYNRPDSIAEAVLMNKTGKKYINYRT